MGRGDLVLRRSGQREPILGGQGADAVREGQMGNWSAILSAVGVLARMTRLIFILT